MISLKTGDTRPLDVVLRRNGQPIDLTDADVVFTARIQTGEDTITGDCTVEGDPEEGQTRLDWPPGATDTPGLWYCEWEVTFPGGQVETIPDGFYETLQILDDL